LGGDRGHSISPIAQTYSPALFALNSRASVGRPLFNGQGTGQW
jgi:hypothetical protein